MRAAAHQYDRHRDSKPAHLPRAAAPERGHDPPTIPSGPQADAGITLNITASEPPSWFPVSAYMRAPSELKARPRVCSVSAVEPVWRPCKAADGHPTAYWYKSWT